MHYDPRWRQEFQQTRSGILQCCDGWVEDVQHIGSTAIEGLIARPVIDVLAGVKGGDQVGEAIASSSDLIEGLNYRVTNAPRWCDGTVVLTKPRHGESTHRVWLTEIGGRLWNQCLAVRRQLLDNRELALRFEEIKVDRWKEGAGDPDQYASGKSDFFYHLIDQIGI